MGQTKNSMCSVNNFFFSLFLSSYLAFNTLMCVRVSVEFVSYQLLDALTTGTKRLHPASKWYHLIFWFDLYSWGKWRHVIHLSLRQLLFAMSVKRCTWHSATSVSMDTTTWLAMKSCTCPLDCDRMMSRMTSLQEAAQLRQQQTTNKKNKTHQSSLSACSHVIAVFVFFPV